MIIVNMECGNDVFLIVKKQTGIAYSNQCGGTACLHPQQEGYLIPLGIEYEWNIPCINDCAYGLIINESEHNKTIDEINECIKEISGELNISLDTSLINESHEAWVHVKAKVRNPRFSWPITTEPGEFDAILVYENSD
jgi:hypothetical protein